ncbi:hypothetical protein [Rhodopirellula baltica]|uniref:hypothetical protein n=1 Tax=Rhodopirellula baltica TaxID=265606 RepID=UPI0002E871C8|nr:hypothetical protein [Rhodopirellula baltica]
MYANPTIVNIVTNASESTVVLDRLLAGAGLSFLDSSGSATWAPQKGASRDTKSQVLTATAA